jgi:hypothetical protein
MEAEGHGRRAPAPRRVEILRSDVHESYRFAIECEGIRRYRGAGGWSGGLVKETQLFGGVSVSGSIAPIVIGKVGEFAVCRLAGVPVDLALRGSGDGGKDLALPCGSVQVKTCRPGFPSAFVRVPAESVEWFVFVAWNGVDRFASVLGYASRHSISAIQPEPSPRGSWMNHVVPLDGLFPIQNLLKIKPIREAI